MDLYSIYIEINKIAFEAFKATLTENDEIAPIPLKKKLIDVVKESVINYVSQKPDMTEQEKHVDVSIIRKRPNNYIFELRMGVNRFHTISKYDGSSKSFKNAITNIGTEKPTPII